MTIDNKISQETRKTSLILQTDTESHTKEQLNLSGIKWKLRSRNRIPKGNPTRLWLRILVYHRNQKLIPSPLRQREDSRHNPKRVALPPTTNRGLNKEIGPRSYSPKEKPQISKVGP